MGQFASDILPQLPRAVNSLGPVLFVGDSLLKQHWVALRHLSGEALVKTNSVFHQAYIMANSYTLMPMGVADLQACAAKLMANDGTTKKKKEKGSFGFGPIGNVNSIFWEHSKEQKCRRPSRK